MTEHNHSVSIHDLEAIWTKLGFDPKDIAEMRFTPYEATITTYLRSASDDRFQLCRCSWCEEGGAGCAHGGLITVNHSFRVSYPEQEKARKELLEGMESDAESFENVELSK